jgi:uncharacterized membrane protein
MSSESGEFTHDEFGMPKVENSSPQVSPRAEYREPSENVSTGRLEAFSDGVFAIAITLLVLEVKIPDFKTAIGPDKTLADFLKEQWPVYVAYFSSFLSIGIIWVNHHIIFKYINRTDRWLLNFNLLLLLTVSFIPYPTDLLGEAIQAQLDVSTHPTADMLALSAGDTTTAALLYIGTLLMMAFAFVLLWGYAIKNFRLVDNRSDPAKLRARQRANYLGVTIYTTAFVIAIFNTAIGIGMTFLVSLIFFVPIGDDRF